MEDVLVWGGAAMVALAGIWQAAKRFAAASPTTKDDEFIEKAEPYVDGAIDTAEKLTGKDLDGDGSVG